MKTAFLLRLPDDLMERLREEAWKEDRKLTSEIERRLRQSFETVASIRGSVSDQMPLMTSDVASVGYANRQSATEVTPLFKQTKKRARKHEESE